MVVRQVLHLQIVVETVLANVQENARRHVQVLVPLVVAAVLLVVLEFVVVDVVQVVPTIVLEIVADVGGVAEIAIKHVKYIRANKRLAGRFFKEHNFHCYKRLSISL